MTEITQDTLERIQQALQDAFDKGRATVKEMVRIVEESFMAPDPVTKASIAALRKWNVWEEGDALKYHFSETDYLEIVALVLDTIDAYESKVPQAPIFANVPIWKSGDRVWWYDKDAAIFRAGIVVNNHSGDNKLVNDVIFDSGNAVKNVPVQDLVPAPPDPGFKLDDWVTWTDPIGARLNCRIYSGPHPGRDVKDPSLADWEYTVITESGDRRSNVLAKQLTTTLAPHFNIGDRVLWTDLLGIQQKCRVTDCFFEQSLAHYTIVTEKGGYVAVRVPENQLTPTSDPQQNTSAPDSTTEEDQVLFNRVIGTLIHARDACQGLVSKGGTTTEKDVHRLDDLARECNKAVEAWRTLHARRPYCAYSSCKYCKFRAAYGSPYCAQHPVDKKFPSYSPHN